jgi:hypothetical protein
MARMGIGFESAAAVAIVNVLVPPASLSGEANGATDNAESA